MKVFYFPSFYPSERSNEKWSGAFTHRQVKAIKELGVNIEVVIPIESYPIWPFYYLFSSWRRNRKKSHGKKRTFEGIEIYHPRIRSPRPSRFFKSYKHYYIKTTEKHIKSRIRENEETYLFGQWMPEASLVVELGKILGLKVGVLAIGDDVIIEPNKSKQNLETFKQCWENADIRGVVADYLGKEANKLVGKELPYSVFYSSVNIEEFIPVKMEYKWLLRDKYGLCRNKVIIICVGSPIIRKGWLDLFDALINIHQDYLLIAVNGGKREIDLNKEAEKRNIQDKFKDIGEIASSEMPEVYQLSDIFCLPSHWEGLANALLEAMSSGLPVITTNISGHPEVVNDNENGFLIEVGDVHKLNKLLSLLIKEQDLRNKIGIKARQSVRDKPGSHKKTAQIIIDSFKNLDHN